MNKVELPGLGDILELTEDWYFDVDWYRSRRFRLAMQIETHEPCKSMLPVGVKLILDKLYISRASGKNEVRFKFRKGYGGIIPLNGQTNLTVSLDDFRTMRFERVLK